MFIRWRAYDPNLAAFEHLRRQMDQFFEELGRQPDEPSFYESRWPHVNLDDAGDRLRLTADLPGVNEDDLNITLNQNMLAISGERRADAPEGYTVHRKERRSVRFSRSFTLPCKVDPEKVSAVTTNGVLTIELPIV